MATIESRDHGLAASCAWLGIELGLGLGSGFGVGLGLGFGVGLGVGASESPSKERSAMTFLTPLRRARRAAPSSAARWPAAPRARLLTGLEAAGVSGVSSTAERSWL